MFSASGPSLLSREPLLWGPAKTWPVFSPLVLGDELHSQGSGGEGDAGFACPDKEWRGIRGAKVVRLSKALVGPAGVLAPVNQAVIEEQCLGLNVAPLTVSGWHYSGGRLDASATLNTKRLLVSIFMLT
ncbi:hypothetical protein PBY51_005091 [Eleginops maclovinus]|uniref:Uncharacterized protein n=1 Tax=Eleginops maclovinus TaxID=56733 RepID=A0AAN7X4U4_ELEMC|nr:hypothetical protein PBY51_005091 [Eleginops maclovinus]